MKKILLISVAFWGIPVMAQAEEPPCEQLNSSWCGRHGYTETSCLSGYTCIKCPLDLSKVYNHRSQVKNCTVGDILWSDNNCYVLETGLVNTSGGTLNAITSVPDNLQPKAVVFDDVNKLAVGLTAMTGGTAGVSGLLYHWQTTKDNYAGEPSLNNNGEGVIGHRLDYFHHGGGCAVYNNDSGGPNEPKYLYFGAQTLTKHFDDYLSYDGCANASDYNDVAAYCQVNQYPSSNRCYSDGVNYQSSPTIGNSYVPCSEPEDACHNQYVAGGDNIKCYRSKGCNIYGMGDPGNFRVPTEELISVGTGTGSGTVTGVIGFSAGPEGYATTSATRGGWSDTVRLLKGTDIDHGFNAPAAMACFGENEFETCNGDACAGSSGGEVGAGHVWFLPSSGDLAKLVDNYTLVKGALMQTYVSTFHGNAGDYQSYNSVGAVLASGNNDYYWSSTQASQSGFYSYAYAVKLSEESTTSTDSCGVTTTITTYSSTMERKGRSDGNRVVCVYHYGDDWDMSSYAALWAGQTQGQQQAPLDDDNTAAAN